MFVLDEILNNNEDFNIETHALMIQILLVSNFMINL